MDNSDDFFKNFGFHFQGDNSSEDFIKGFFNTFNLGKGPKHWPVDWLKVKKSLEEIDKKNPGEEPNEHDSHRWKEAVITADLWIDSGTRLEPMHGKPVVLGQKSWIKDAMNTATDHLVVEFFCDRALRIFEHRVIAALQENIPDLLEKQMATKPFLINLLKTMVEPLITAQIQEAYSYAMNHTVHNWDYGYFLLSNEISPVRTDAVAKLVKQNNLDEDQVLLFLALQDATYRRVFRSSYWLIKHLANHFKSLSDTLINPDFSPLLKSLTSMQDQFMFSPEAMQSMNVNLSLSDFINPFSPEFIQRSMDLRNSLALIRLYVLFQIDKATARFSFDSNTIRKAVDAYSKLPENLEKTEHLLLRNIVMTERNYEIAMDFMLAVKAARGEEAWDYMFSEASHFPTPEQLKLPDAWLLSVAEREAEAGHTMIEDNRELTFDIPDDLSELEDPS